MAVTTTTAQSAVSLGSVEGANNIREDLGNIIFNVTPYQTPFTSGIAKSRATNDNHEWLTDTYRDAATDNENLEAAAVSDAAADTRTRKGNYLQIAKEVATVTLKAELLDKAGIKGKEMAYQLMKKGKELHMDIEAQSLSIQIKVEPQSAQAGRSAGVASWINTNENTNSGTDNTASTGLTVPVPGSGAFTEQSLATLLDGVWTNSGDFGNVCIMAPAATVSSMRNNLGSAMTDSIESDASTGEIYNRVAVYVSQFGPVKVVPNKHMPAATMYVLDMSSWGLAFGGGKMIHTTDIATQTSAERKLLESYYTLESRSEEANAGYYGIS